MGARNPSSAAVPGTKGSVAPGLGLRKLQVRPPGPRGLRGAPLNSQVFEQEGLCGNVAALFGMDQIREYSQVSVWVFNDGWWILIKLRRIHVRNPFCLCTRYLHTWWKMPWAFQFLSNPLEKLIFRSVIEPLLYIFSLSLRWHFKANSKFWHVFRAFQDFKYISIQQCNKFKKSQSIKRRWNTCWWVRLCLVATKYLAESPTDKEKVELERSVNWCSWTSQMTSWNPVMCLINYAVLWHPYLSSPVLTSL